MGAQIIIIDHRQQLVAPFAAAKEDELHGGIVNQLVQIVRPFLRRSQIGIAAAVQVLGLNYLKAAPTQLIQDGLVALEIGHVAGGTDANCSAGRQNGCNHFSSASLRVLR